MSPWVATTLQSAGSERLDQTCSADAVWRCQGEVEAKEQERSELEQRVDNLEKVGGAGWVGWDGTGERVGKETEHAGMEEGREADQEQHRRGHAGQCATRQGGCPAECTGCSCMDVTVHCGPPDGFGVEVGFCFESGRGSCAGAHEERGCRSGERRRRRRTSSCRWRSRRSGTSWTRSRARRPRFLTSSGPRP
eukprot:3132510-Rhodomonas_salina.1